MKYIPIYLIAINLITFILFLTDKIKAVKHKWRIPEATLISLSALGGSVGGLCAMYIFRHKTRKAIFKYGIPLILAIQIAVIIYFYR